MDWILNGKKTVILDWIVDKYTFWPLSYSNAVDKGLESTF
jgi:hypothetical protein